MQKLFYEVFPGLEEQGGGISDLLRQVRVEKVTSNRTKTRIRVYIVSEKLLHKEQLFKLEKKMKKQLFPEDSLELQLIERYELSSQYTPQEVMRLYRDSISYELRAYSILPYQLFQKAEITYPEPDELHLKMTVAKLEEDAADELERVLHKILVERCGLRIRITAEHVEKEITENKAHQQVEKRAQDMIAAMMRKQEGAQEQGTAEVFADPQAQPPTDKPAGESKGAPENAAKPEAAPKFEKGGFAKKEGGFKRPLKRSDNPDVIYGREITGEIIPIDQILGEMGEVTVSGQVIALDEREIRGERTILTIALTDFTDTIRSKIFVSNDDLPAIKETIKTGAFLKICGMSIMDPFDKELGIGSVVGIMKSADTRKKRKDLSEKKRVELHCHTKMSDMDGVSDVGSIMKQAKAFGHKALAVTDHGVVQAFTEASHKLDKGDPFKLIYGVEAYLVDDLKDIVSESRGQSLSGSYVVFDLETTGFSAETNKIIEIGAVKVEGGLITQRFSTFVNPQTPIPYEIETLTGIDDSMVIDVDTIEVVLPQFMEFCRGSVLVAHNAGFDTSFIAKKLSAPESGVRLLCHRYSWTCQSASAGSQSI